MYSGANLTGKSKQHTRCADVLSTKSTATAADDERNIRLIRPIVICMQCHDHHLFLLKFQITDRIAHPIYNVNQPLVSKNRIFGWKNTKECGILDKNLPFERGRLASAVNSLQRHRKIVQMSRDGRPVPYEVCAAFSEARAPRHRPTPLPRRSCKIPYITAIKGCYLCTPKSN